MGMVNPFDTPTSNPRTDKFKRERQEDDHLCICRICELSHGKFRRERQEDHLDMKTLDNIT